ncbi:hypothetical protein [uncultured Roseivirga sp.]|uniref:hypothetical protein n=1 Tax=uncultured Roseivirga sp. TaxID=543088 RepID=UPI0030D82B26|tara:strand:- start:31526 stop:31897 length:372 start_codon:yes stop_codon:yes gene_type:complete
MNRQLLRIFTFGILGMSMHSMSALGQEGEEVLLPVPRHENTAIQDSLIPVDLHSEGKRETPRGNGESVILNSELNTVSLEKPSERKDNQPKVANKEDNQSALSFNFLYYIFYKFKPSEVFEKK